MDAHTALDRPPCSADRGVPVVIPLPRIEMNWKLAAGLALAAMIAWFFPFDRAFGAATLGIPALRSAAIVALAVAGLAVGGRIGLGVEARGFRRPILASLAIAAAVAVACAMFDALMRPALHPSYVQMVASASLGARMTLYMLRAFNENIIYRLFLASVMIWLLGRVWRIPDGRPASGAFWVGLVASQVINIWVNNTGLAALTPLALAHDGLRYVAPGVVWGWLYWRRGFQSCEIACTSVHVVLQPLLTIGLA